MLVEKYNAKAVVGSLSNHEGDGDGEKNVTNWTFNNKEKTFSAPCTLFIHLYILQSVVRALSTTRKLIVLQLY